jgi:NifU-like protein involved in Fe-S cluster formation
VTAYSERVRAYFAAPAHAGDLPDGQVVNVDDQGVRLRLSAIVVGGIVESMRFRAWGCPHTIAAAEAACALLEGAPAETLLEFPISGLMEELSIPVEKTGRILVLEDAVRSLGRAIGDGS